jgi:hypothetical protein
MRQSEGTGRELMVMGIPGQDGQHFACAQAWFGVQFDWTPDWV